MALALLASMVASVGARAADRELTEQELDEPTILLPPGTRVPENLNNPDLWREWIERQRGTPLPPDFRKVAHIFQEEGERLGIFWPGVLVQSIHETDYYQYGGRARAENFNIGGGVITQEEGTTTRQNFHTLRNGIRAMLEHVAVYANPYNMENKIREQNYRELGTRRFTADRTEEQFNTIRGKYDHFRRKWNRAVRFNDLGSYVSPEKLSQMEGFGEYGPILQLIGGAALTYAGDPSYGAKFYVKWHHGADYVRTASSATSFQGVWNTNWGEMRLTQSGTNVTGSYTHDKGKIAGTAEGNVLKGKWSEAPSYSEPKDAGDVELELSEDGNSFSGKWRYGSSGSWNGGWTGTRK